MASVFNVSKRNDLSFFRPPSDVNNICANFGIVEVICLRSRTQHALFRGNGARRRIFKRARTVRRHAVIILSVRFMRDVPTSDVTTASVPI